MSRQKKGKEGLSDRLAGILSEHDRISQAEDIPSAARLIYQAVYEHLPETTCGLFLSEDSNIRLLQPTPSPEAPAVESLLQECSEAVVRAIRTGDGILLRGSEDGAPEGGCQIVVPLLTSGEVVGALEVRSSDSGSLGDEEELVVQMLAKCSAVALKNLRTREQYRKESARLKTLIDSSADAIITTDHHGNITLFSPGAEEAYGYRADEVLGTPVMQYYYRGRREAEQVMRRLRAEGKVKNYETWFRAKSGRGIPTSLSCSLLHDRRGKVVGTLGVLKDITRQKEMEEKLNYTIERLQEANEQLEVLAITDNLSGLYNHRYFIRELDEELERCIRTRRPLSVLMVDIDKFKSFNDTYGHQVGDQIIEEIGRVVLRSIRRVDTGCRYGGEEFTVILPETAGPEARLVADRIRMGFRRSPLFGELKTRPATLSIGVAIYDPRKGRVPPAEIVRCADLAMYRVKRQGGDAVDFAEVDPEHVEETNDVLG